MPDLTRDELNKIIDPEVNADTFIFGRNNDATRSPRTWLMKPLLYQSEKQFRKVALPLLSIAYVPFENLMSSFGSNYVAGYSPSIVTSFFQAEVDMDDKLEDALLVILESQDKSITKKWLIESAESRDQIFDIVMRQCYLNHLMDKLGESLAERFGTIAKTMGLSLDLPTLKQLWKQALEKLSAKITTFVSAVDNVTGPYTESSLKTGSLQAIPEVPVTNNVEYPNTIQPVS